MAASASACDPSISPRELAGIAASADAVIAVFDSRSMVNGSITRCLSPSEHGEAKVRTHLGAQLAPGATIVQEGVTVAFGIHRRRHLEDPRGAHRNAKDAALASLCVDGNGSGHPDPAATDSGAA